MKYTEMRYLLTSDLRNLCIKEDWYTEGTNEEYEALFARLKDEDGIYIHLTTEKLAELAEDIIEHSEMPDECETETVMFVLATRCITRFDKAN